MARQRRAKFLGAEQIFMIVHGFKLVEFYPRPAIALTGFGQPEDLVKSKASGFDLHLNKPVSLEAMSEAVAALERR